MALSTASTGEISLRRIRVASAVADSVFAKSSVFMLSPRFLHTRSLNNPQYSKGGGRSQGLPPNPAASTRCRRHHGPNGVNSGDEAIILWRAQFAAHENMGAAE